MKKSQIIGRVFLTALIVFAFSSSLSAGSDIRMIDTPKLHDLVVDSAFRREGGRQEHHTIIDARTEDEYAKAHVFSSINVPERDLEKSTELLPKDKSALLVVYDNDPKQEMSAKKWAEKAATSGYRNVFIYSEGFSAWRNSSMPVVPF